MPELIDDGDRRLIVVGRFRLIFRWTGDRWTHALETFDPGESEISPRVLALTLEGDLSRDDPTRVVSPTYQDLQFQEQGETLQALLVGQSGPHHFSAVFAVKSAGESVEIAVDVADRCRGLVNFLASTYTVDARSSELVGADGSEAAWDLGSGRLTFSAHEPTQVCLAEAGRSATQIQALAGPGQETATRRFLYRWSWVPQSV